MKTSEQIELISKAVSIAQGEMNPASKSTVNPFFKSTYSNLTQVWDAIREPLSKNNLSVFQDVISTANGIAVSTRVCHASGQWIEFGPLEITLVKKDAQALGSATSYAKRYALCAAIGVVADEDDDGEKAMNRNGKGEPKQEEKKIDPKVEQDKLKILLLNFPKEDHKMINSYLDMLSTTFKNKPRIEFIDSAIGNFEGFHEKFNTWKINQLAEGK